MNVDGLKPWQPDAVCGLKAALEKHGAALDGSPTGAGKSYHAGCLLRHYNLPTLVVCPKISISMWHRVAAHFGIEVNAWNREKLRTGRQPFGRWEKDNRGRVYWQWAKEIKMLVLDEAHRDRGIRTQNAAMMWAAKRQGIPTLALTATPAVSPLNMRALGYLLGLHNGGDFFRWARNHGCVPGPFGGFVFTGKGWEGGQTAVMNKIGAQLFPERGVRLRIEDIPEFPENLIIAELVDVANPERFDDLMAEMADALNDLHAAKVKDRDPNNPMTRLLRAHQEIEILMVPLLVEMCEDATDQGYSVPIFVRFKETLRQLAAKLKCDCQIHGDQTPDERDEAIETFQTNRENRILLTIDAGGESIGLHDLEGGHPRQPLLLPGFDAWKLQQAIGRAPRTGAKTKVVTKVLFPNTPVGRRLHRNVSRKLSNLSALVDADLDPRVLELQNA